LSRETNTSRTLDVCAQERGVVGTCSARPLLRTKVVLGAISVALLWALCYPLVTTAVEYAPPLKLGALRALLAGLVLLGLSVRRNHPRGRDWLAVAAIGISATGLGFAGMFLAGGRVAPGIATVIANSQPLLAAVIGSFALHEAVSIRASVGMMVSFGGIATIAAPALKSPNSESVTIAGILFVLLGALGVAMGNVIMKRCVRRLDPIAATGWQLLIGAAFLGFVSSVWGSDAEIQWTVPFLIALAGLAIPGTAVAFALWFGLLGRAPLTILNVFSFLTPVFALAIGAAFYDERLTMMEVIGACLVVGGAWMAARSPGIAKRRE